MKRKTLAHLFLLSALLGLSVHAEAKPTRLIVRFKEHTSSYASDTMLHSLGVKKQKKLSNLQNIEVLELAPNRSLKKIQEIYERNPNVLYAEPDFEIRVKPLKKNSKASAMEPTKFEQQWALNNEGQKVGKSVGLKDADLNASEAWEITKGDREVAVGVIDTGVLYTHPNLKDNIWENPGEIPGNGIDDDGNGIVDDVHGINSMDRSGDPKDDNGHGTHCAGIIGGTNVHGEGTYGINQKVSIVGCKFLDADGSGRMSDALACMDYFSKLKTRTEHPVNIVAINASWGGGGKSKAMEDAIRKLGDDGILFVAAAGNDGEDNDQVSSYPANYRLPNIISVAATNNRDELADFSNFGAKSVHVAAPGVDIMSTVLDDGYDMYSGTSMATPYVTGLIALLKSKKPSLTPMELKNLVIAGGNSLGSLEGKVLSGRRIRAADKDGSGSLTCSNQRSHFRMLPQSSSVSAKVGDVIEFAVTKIRCGEADGAPVTAVSLGHTVRLLDQDDNGIYAGEWKAEAPGIYDFDLGVGEKVTVTVQ